VYSVATRHLDAKDVFRIDTAQVNKSCRRFHRHRKYDYSTSDLFGLISSCSIASMPALLRRRLVCFYCNHKSALTRDPSLREFRCNNCDAVNYLDEVRIFYVLRCYLLTVSQNGEITDPPSTPIVQSQKFATASFGAGVNPDFISADDNIFCDTCLKNQQFYVNALASYLPDPSDPDYPKYEAKLPEYKANLEKRYPQVCSSCVERVNNRIKSMTYLTKAENLKFSLDRTRKNQFPTRDTGLKSIVVFLGMWLWHISILGQSLWHYMGIMSLRLASTIESNSPSTISSCTTQIARFDGIDVECFDRTTQFMPMILQAGLLSFWWNNRLRESVQGYGRLSHLNDYYTLQVIFLAVRYAAYWALSQPERFALPVPLIAVHAFMIIFSLAVSI
jgi:Ima1 N-terminal domain